MTHAELMRKLATDAINEGGVWFSGEYMTMLAGMAESIEAENAKLRELAKKMLKSMKTMDTEWCSLSDFETVNDAAQVYDFDARVAPEYEEELRKLGVLL